jgi:nitrogen regulatory protein P-II 1
MKEIKAVIQSHMFTKVMESLHAIPHFPGATVSECEGQGRGRGTGGKYVPTVQSIFLSKMTKLEVICSDEICDELVRAIQHAAHTGNPGDGLVVVMDVARAVRIRTGQEQDAAV